MANESWHLSKTIPITLIFSIVIQTIILVVFLTDLAGTVATNTGNIQENKDNITAVNSVVQRQEVTLGRIDENIKSIKGILENVHQ